MTWVRIDDGATEHHKLAQCGPLGLALWVAGLAYCNRNLTDGFIPTSIARRLVDWSHPDAEGKPMQIAATWNGELVGGGWDIESDEVIAVLIRVGLWEQSGGGYRVHDYLDYQPSKDEVLALREKRAAAGRKGGLATQAHAKADAQASAPAKEQAKLKPQPQPHPVPIEGQPSTPPPLPALDAESGIDHHYVIRNTQGLSDNTVGSIERLLASLPDATDRTIGRLVSLARRGASQADFEDARSGIREAAPQHPSRYACHIIQQRMNAREVPA